MESSIALNAATHIEELALPVAKTATCEKEDRGRGGEEEKDIVLLDGNDIADLTQCDGKIGFKEGRMIVSSISSVLVIVAVNNDEDSCRLRGRLRGKGGIFNDIILLINIKLKIIDFNIIYYRKSGWSVRN